METPSAGRVTPRPLPYPRPISRRSPRSPRSIPNFRPLLRPLHPPPSWPCSRSPPPRAPAHGPGRQYLPKGRRCRRSDGRGCRALFVGGQVRVAWEMAQEASCSRKERHKPSPILTPPPAVAPRALPAGVSTLARPCGRDRGGAGQVLGATAAPLDRLSVPSAWATRRILRPPWRRRQRGRFLLDLL